MCLLIAGKSNAIRAVLLNTRFLLEDIFQSNADGLGAMYATSKHKLRTPKLLPKTLAECEAFIRQLPNDDRNLALHWRMRTHGDTDLANCHPYDVVPGAIALMHNGILQQGNKADTSKSDTWHYIKDVVHPMLSVAPQMMKVDPWISLIEDDITGNNRFALMDNTGELVIMNKHTGVSHDGIWFSNTYAWSPELLIPGYKKYSYPTYSGKGRGSYTHWSEAGLEDPLDDDTKYVAGPLDVSEDEVWEALQTGDATAMENLMLELPYTALWWLLKDCDFVPASPELLAEERLDIHSEAIVKLLADGDIQALYQTVKAGNVSMVAEAVCWYGDWVGKAINEKGKVPDFIAANMPKDMEEQKLWPVLAKAEDHSALPDAMTEVRRIAQEELQAELADLNAAVDAALDAAEAEEKLEVYAG